MRFLLTILLLIGCATTPTPPRYECPSLKIRWMEGTEKHILRKIDKITIHNARKRCANKPADNPNKCLVRLDIYPNYRYFVLCGVKRKAVEDGLF